METWRYLAIIGILLAISAYMFLSLFFPPLRWMFRMKGFAANLFGMDEEQNAEFGNRLGLILAPVIGLATLGLAWSAIKDWRSDRQRQVARATERSAVEEEPAAALGGWDVARVYLIGAVENGPGTDSDRARAGSQD